VAAGFVTVVTERTGLGIIGTGRWADAHAEAAARSDVVKIVNCFSRSPEKRSAFASRHGLERSSDSIEALLADDQVGAVIVSSPNDSHAEHVIQVVTAGKPALVDKPLAVSVAEGLELARSASGQAPVGVAHNARRLAGHRAARDWIASGRAGVVRVAHADFSNARGGELPEDAWYRTARGSEAGVLIQVGIHPIETLLYLLGPAISVNARFAFEALGPTMPDAAIALVTHRSGAMSTLSTSWTTPSHYVLDLQATSGNLEYRLDHSKWKRGDVDDFGTLTLDAPDQPRRKVDVARGDPLREQLKELAGSARHGTPMEVGITEGLRAVAVVEASVLSAAQGGAPIEVEHLLSRAGATDGEIGSLLGV
jgi:predicted dehydrogenase